ncbi:hypothetical protein [Salana multivorans]
MSNAALPQPAPPSGYPPPVPPPVQSGNGLATAGFVLGLLGFLGSFIPLLNVVGIVLGVIGAILAAVGLAKAKTAGSGKGLAVAGVILGVLAVIVAIIINVAFANAVDDVVGSTTTVTAQESAHAVDGDPAESAAGQETPTGAATTGEADQSAAEVVPLPPDANPALAVAGIESLPDGEPGALSVVTQAAMLDRSGSLPIVVRNLTDRPVARVEVTGTVRDASGALIGSGSDQGLTPFVVGPGEVAIGYVYFGIEGLPDDATFELSVTGTDPADIFLGEIDLIVTEHNRTEDSILVMLQNDTDKEVSGPIGVQMMCFDEAGVPVDTHTSYTEQEAAAPGGSVSTSFSFYGDAPCERYILGGSGFDF